MHVFVSVHVHVHVHVYVYVHEYDMYMYMYMYFYMYMYMYVYMYMNMYMCMYVDDYMYMYMYMTVYVYVYVHVLSEWARLGQITSDWAGTGHNGPNSVAIVAQGRLGSSLGNQAVAGVCGPILVGTARPCSQRARIACQRAMGWRQRSAEQWGYGRQRAWGSGGSIALACAGLVVRLWVGEPTPPPLLRALQFALVGKTGPCPRQDGAAESLGPRAPCMVGFPSGTDGPQGQTSFRLQGTRNPQVWSMWNRTHWQRTRWGRHRAAYPNRRMPLDGDTEQLIKVLLAAIKGKPGASKIEGASARNGRPTGSAFADGAGRSWQEAPFVNGPSRRSAAQACFYGAVGRILSWQSGTGGGEAAGIETGSAGHWAGACPGPTGVTQGRWPRGCDGGQRVHS